MSAEWPRLSPSQYEDMVSILLSCMNPETIRVDGSGGDGGKDVYFDEPDGLTIYELKSFTGRVTSNRRSQIKNSFKKALKLKPKTWNLVCPIDLTNAERAWFDKLTSDSGIPCHWFGKTWLDARMSENPHVGRYFLADVNDKLVELAKLFQQERAALSNGVSDAVERLKALKEQCDELDPFYTVDFATDSATGTVTTTMRPRYPGAERDRPIKLRAHLAFPHTPEALSMLKGFQDAVDFGVNVDIPEEFVSSVSVDAPLGLGGEFGSGRLTLDQPELVGSPSIPMKLQVTTPHGAHLCTINLTGSVTSAGAKGFIGELRDHSGMLKATFRADMSARTFNLTYNYEPQVALPSVVLPPLLFVASCVRGNRVQVLLEDGKPLGDPVELPSTLVDNPANVVELVRQLERIQSATHSYFDVPETFTADDIQSIGFVDALLLGERVPGTWNSISMGCKGAHGNDFLRVLDENGALTGQACSLIHAAELTFVLNGNEMPLGVVATHLPSARLADVEATVAALSSATDGQVVTVEFVPANSNECERWVGVPEGIAESPATVSQTGSSLVNFSASANSPTS